MFAAATIPGAVIGALNTAYVPRRLFDTIFGIILLAIAVFLFLRPGLKVKERKAKQSRFHYHVTHHLVEADGVSYCYSFNPLIGIVLSFLWDIFPVF
jgi:uncharacterized membrane protein YfcA